MDKPACGLVRSPVPAKPHTPESASDRLRRRVTWLDVAEAGAEAQAERKALIERHSEDPRRRSRRMRANGRAISPSIWDGSSARRRATLPGANAPGANSSNGAAAAVGRQSRMDALLIVSASLY